MIKYYKHKESNKKIRVIQYDGTVESIQQMIKILGQNIIVTESSVYICDKHIMINNYCVIYTSNNISIYSSEIFKEIYIEYIPERKFKCDRRIMIHLWKEVHQAPDMYTVSIVDGFIVITGNVSKNRVKITEALTITRINPEYSLNSIEKKIVDMCDEI